MNKITKKIKYLPIIILFVLLVAVYFVFLKDSKLFNLNKPPEVRRINGFPTTIVTDKQIEKHREVILNEEQLNEFLNEIDDSGYLFLREEINFDKEMLLAVSTDVNQYEGHTIKIRKLYEDKENNTLLVSLRETVLGSTCDLVESPNVAVDIVAISITDLKIDFERVKEIEECN